MSTINTPNFSFIDWLKSLKEKFYPTHIPTDNLPLDNLPLDNLPPNDIPVNDIPPIPPAPHTPPTYTYPNGNPIPFRSKKNPFNNGELYHSRDGKMYKAICRATMYYNEEEHYVMLQELNDTCEITKLPTLVLEDDFESGEMFEACNRFLS